MRITDENLHRLGPVLTGDDAAVGLIVDGRYRVERRIARGGMGEILYATDLRLDRPVAMKVLAPDLSTPEWVRRFEAEARTMAQIEHPGIVPLHDFGTFPDGRLFYTMKFIDGETLAVLLERREDRNRLIEILARVCEILQFAHERKILHRDLKPSNIMVDRHGQVYVMDWGIARVLDDLLQTRAEGAPVRAGLTSAGTILGTLEYMSPEQAEGDVAKLDARSDLFSLGAILYEVLTGFPPVKGSTVTDLIAAAREASPPHPRDRNPAVPRDLDSICRKAIAKDREQRYASTLALAEDLRRFLRADPLVARPLPTVGRLWRKTVLNRKIVTTSGVAVTLGLAVGIWFVVRSRRDSEHRVRTEEALKLLEAARPALNRAHRYLRSADAEFPELVRHANEAQALIEEALRKAPSLAIGHCLLGIAWDLKGEDERAVSCWAKAIELDPKLGPAHFRLGRAFLIRHYLSPGSDVAEAESELTAALAPDRGFDDALERHITKAMIAYLQREPGLVERIAFNGIGLFQGREGTEELYWLGGLSVEGSDRLRAFDQAVVLQPNFAMARFSRGVERTARRDYSVAIEDYSVAIRTRPRFAEAYRRRGHVWELRRNLDRAIADYAQALQVAPPDWPRREGVEGALKAARARLEAEGREE